MTDTWRKLAAMTGPCPECGGFGRGRPTLAEPDGAAGGCPTCHGTGQGPLIPGLRKPCPHNHDGHASYQSMRAQDAPYRTCICGVKNYGVGWIPASGPEAIVAAQEFILSQRTENGWWDFDAERSEDGIIITIFHEWGQLGMSDPQPTYEPALAQALERALEKEKP